MLSKQLYKSFTIIYLNLAKFGFKYGTKIEYMNKIISMSSQVTPAASHFLIFCAISNEYWDLVLKI